MGSNPTPSATGAEQGRDVDLRRALRDVATIPTLEAAARIDDPTDANVRGRRPFMRRLGEHDGATIDATVSRDTDVELVTRGLVAR